MQYHMQDAKSERYKMLSKNKLQQLM